MSFFELLAIVGSIIMGLVIIGAIGYIEDLAKEIKYLKEIEADFRKAKRTILVLESKNEQLEEKLRSLKEPIKVDFIKFI
jgi:nitrate reductase NapAB chaperone NapD